MVEFVYSALKKKEKLLCGTLTLNGRKSPPTKIALQHRKHTFSTPVMIAQEVLFGGDTLESAAKKSFPGPIGATIRFLTCSKSILDTKDSCTENTILIQVQ